MWNFSNLARPSGQFGRPGHNYPYPPPHFNRADGGDSKMDAVKDALIYKGSAVLTSGIVGSISAYKGLPEVKGTMGLLSFDVIVGLLLSGAEVYSLMKGKSGKGVAVMGGVSTGLLCHWAAVQGTLWGAGKAKAEAAPAGPATKGFDYNAQERAALPDARRNVAPAAARPQAQPAAAGKSFDPYYGMM